MNGLTCEGCTCGHCGQPILFFLSSLQGVTQIVPNFHQKTIMIQFDEKNLTKEKLIQTIKNRGFAIEEV